MIGPGNPPVGGSRAHRFRGRDRRSLGGQLRSRRASSSARSAGHGRARAAIAAFGSASKSTSTSGQGRRTTTCITPGALPVVPCRRATVSQGPSERCTARVSAGQQLRVELAQFSGQVGRAGSAGCRPRPCPRRRPAACRLDHAPLRCGRHRGRPHRGHAAFALGPS
jgi:hypothetical protein